MATESIGFWTGVRQENLSAVAKNIWELLPQPCFVALEAEMGCGKTTLVSSLLMAAGVAHFEGSPTFALVQNYDSPVKVQFITSTAIALKMSRNSPTLV